MPDGEKMQLPEEEGKLKMSERLERTFGNFMPAPRNIAVFMIIWNREGENYYLKYCPAEARQILFFFVNITI